MAYSKNTWANGDVITAAKLNNLEDGVSDALSGSSLVVNGEMSEEDSEYYITIDSDADAICAAVAAGKAVVMLVTDEDDQISIWSLTDSGEAKDENFADFFIMYSGKDYYALKTVTFSGDDTTAAVAETELVSADSLAPYSVEGTLGDDGNGHQTVTLSVSAGQLYNLLSSCRPVKTIIAYDKDTTIESSGSFVMQKIHVDGGNDSYSASMLGTNGSIYVTTSLGADDTVVFTEQS